MKLKSSKSASGEGASGLTQDSVIANGISLVVEMIVGCKGDDASEGVMVVVMGIVVGVRMGRPNCEGGEET